jgi:hypothetical protein
MYNEANGMAVPYKDFDFWFINQVEEGSPPLSYVAGTVACSIRNVH